MIKNLNIVVLLSFMCSLAIGQNLNEITTTTGLTKIEFQESTFEFGEIEEGEKIKNVFIFKNTGTEPLIITNAKGSCGCTIPMYPKEPIMPGESADLLVEFNSKGKGSTAGAQQSKRVSITANTDPAISYLTIKGKVFKTEGSKPAVEIAPATAQATIKVDQSKLNSDIDSEQVLMFPNPTDNELNVSLKDFAKQAGSIEIYNGAGAKVIGKNVSDFGEDQVFNVADYAPGVYTVSIKVDGKNRIAKRFVVPANE